MSYWNLTIEPRVVLVTEDLLTSLHTLFPLHSVAALDLIDHHSVSLITSPSGRKIYSCLGSTGTPYLICYTGFTCTCSAFRHDLNNAADLWCKHLLAVQLSIAMDIVQERQVEEDVLISMLSELFLMGEWAYKCYRFLRFAVIKIVHHYK